MIGRVTAAVPAVVRAALAAAVAGLPLSACPLPEPADLQFVESDYVTGGQVVDELDFGPAMEGDGYSDCTLVYVLEGRTGEPVAGCPGCEVEAVVDLLLGNDGCPRLPSGQGSSILGLSIGLNGDRGYFFDGANWVQWTVGELDGSTYEGGTGWLAQQGWQLRESLTLEWIPAAE